MHRHACIEAYNAPITSTAVEITIIILISVLLYAYVVIIGIHACLCLALLIWSQKHPRNHSFCVGLHEEVLHAIRVVDVYFFMGLPIVASGTGGRSLIFVKRRLKQKKVQ